MLTTIHHFRPGATKTSCGLEILKRKATLPLTCTFHRITCRSCKKTLVVRPMSYVAAKGG